MDRPYFTGPFWLLPGIKKKGRKVSVTVIRQGSEILYFFYAYIYYPAQL